MSAPAPAPLAHGQVSPPLSRLLVQTARCVQAVQAGRSLTTALPEVPGPLRPGVQALTFHALRHLGTTQALVAALADKAPPAPARALLCAALALLLPLANAHAPVGRDPSQPMYDAFTVVDQAVEAARAVRGMAGQAGMVNACLRRFLREQAELLAQVGTDWEARYNHPAWWVKRVRRDHPQHWQAILAANNTAAPLVLRVNVAHISRADYLVHLANAGLPATPVGASGVVLGRSVAVEGLPGYAQGWFSVQDPAAQLAAPLLLDGLPAKPGRPLRVLDACAAPGGKTAHLLEHAHQLGLGVDVLALEVDAQRSQRITENLQRLALPASAPTKPVTSTAPSTARTVVADAGEVARWWDGVPFDAILLDAPCTASGIVRRHPDVRWLRRETDVPALAATQQRLLEALWPLLKPGGRLVYCTCSVFRAEGQQQVDAFVQRHTNAVQGAAPGHLLPATAGGAADLVDNPVSENDGFYYARLDKSDASCA
ncbi:MAG: 16S rRNA (cytosine(967)-C(5))-methyltransferase RsmB [Polaromonas sp.]|nr:16S rRNA (cytosine(967)-C(5))-methyltransferase RsmB [Polaromonas sp.]